MEMLMLGLLGMFWTTGTSCPAARAYPAGFAGYFEADAGFPYLPVVYGASGSSVTATNYWYDISAGSWQSGAGAPSPSRYDCAGTLSFYNGEKMLFVFGGSDGSNFYSSAHRYSYSSNSWTTIASLPWSAEGVMAAGPIGPGDSIFVMGGHNSGGVLSNNSVYIPSSNNYYSRTSIPTPRAEAAVAVGVNENNDTCIYLVSGTNGTDMWGPTYTNRVDEFNPKTNSWRQRASFPGVARNGASAVTLKDTMIYVLGGTHFYHDDYGNYWWVNYTDIWVYNTKSNTWTRSTNLSAPWYLPNLPGGRDGGVAAAPDFPPNPVSLLSPANGTQACQPTLVWSSFVAPVKIVYAVGGDANNNVYTTTWLAKARFGSYTVYLGTSPTGLSQVYTTTDSTDTTWTCTSCNANQTYYWRVLVADEFGDTAWSNIYSFSCDPTALGLDETGQRPSIEVEGCLVWAYGGVLSAYDPSGRLLARGERVRLEPGVYVIILRDPEGRMVERRKLLLR